MAASSFAVDPGTVWTLRNPLPTNAYLQASAWTGSQMVVVGHGGLVLTSPDGISWTKRNSGSTASLLAVVWTGTQLVAAGESGTILASTDGITWSRRISGTSRAIKGIVWTGLQFVAVGETGLAMTSLTGTSWTTRFTGTSADLNAVTQTGSTLVAVGDLGVTLTSSTGTSWAQVSQTPSINFTSATWTGSQIIGVTSNGTILTSPTGAVWTQQYVSGSASFFGIGWTGSQAIAVGSGGTIVTSPDGLAWTVQTSGVGSFLLGATQAGGQSLVIGEGGVLLTSPDGVTWTQRSQVSSKSLRDLAWTGTSLIAVGEDGAVLTSPSGTTWSIGASGSPSDLEAITWAGTQVVAVGEGGTILTSPDGVTWTAQTSGTAQRLLGIVWTRSQLVAVGASGTILTSPNGITWTAQISGTAADLRGIAWTGSQLVAVGVGGVITISTNSTSWTPSVVAPFADLSEVLWTGSQLVAVGDGDTVLTSPNGTAWTQKALSFSQNLLGIASTGGLLAIVGTSQTILTSPLTAATWTSVSLASPKLPRLNSVEWVGTQLVAVGDSGTIMTSGTPSPPTPVVSFNLVSSTVAESVGTVTLGVNLSIAPLTSITIPFTALGTAIPSIPAAAATNGVRSDFTATPTPITFAAGQSAKNITITINNDVLVESTEAIVVAMTNPTQALIGGNNRFVLDITDNDIAPVVTIDPVSQMVEVGEPVASFTTFATGSSPLTYQWQKNGRNIASATGSTYSIFDAQLGHAGRYAALARNPTASDLSDVAELGVVDTTPATIQVPIGRTARMQISAAGNGLSYQWYKDFSPLSDDARITGSTTSRLTIANLVPLDTDLYYCEVSGPGGILDGGYNDLTVLLPPVVTPPSPPSTMVSGLYSHGLSASNFPTAFTVTGLPPGLTVNASTGVISGRATLPGTYLIQVTASNAAGTSPPVTASLAVQPLPQGSVGSFTGIISREATVNSSLGGRFHLTTTATGSFTGNVVVGTSTKPFSGKLDSTFSGNPQGTLTIPDSTLQLAFTISGPGNSLTGSLSTGGPAATITAWRNVWHPTANPSTSHAGYYTIGLDLAPGDIGITTIPQGKGFASLTATASGNVTTNGRLGDGSAFTSSSLLGPSGEFAIYQTTFGTAGSILGSLAITPDPLFTFINNAISGPLTWARITAAAPGTRAYPAAFGPITLTAYGKYLASAEGQPILGLPSPATSPQLLFTQGGVSSSVTNPNISFTFTATSTVIVPTPGGLSNPGRTSLSIDPTTGSVTGSFSLVDLAVTRPVSYRGVILRPASGPTKAVGYFLLPQLPLLNNTSPILSGQMVITQ